MEYRKYKVTMVSVIEPYEVEVTAHNGKAAMRLAESIAETHAVKAIKATPMKEQSEGVEHD